MPYISEEARKRIDEKLVVEDVVCNCFSVGELNYILTTIVKRYIEVASGENEGLSYGDINDAIGTLECCKLELYRRLAAPYEDKKIKENGDVY